MSIWDNCKIDSTLVVFFSIPAGLIEWTTPKYLQLQKAAEEHKMWCSNGGCSECNDRRHHVSFGDNEVQIDVYKVPTGDIYSADYDTSVHDFYAFCRDYESGKWKSTLRKERNDNAPGMHNKSDLIAIGKMQQWKCYFCFTDLDVIDHRGHWDHLTPLSRGGSKFPSNMAYTCPPCNLKKGAQTEDEFWEYLSENRLVKYIARKRKFHESYREEKLALDMLYLV